MSDSPIERDERLGRGIFSKHAQRRLQDFGSLPPWSIVKDDFSPPSDRNDVSMDRLDRGDCVELTKIQDAIGQTRTPSRKLSGWLHCPASVFLDKGWPTEASPVLDPQDGLLPNPYHCHIRVNKKGKEGALEVLKAGTNRWGWQERCDPE